MIPISATMMPTCVSEANVNAHLMSVCTRPVKAANKAVIRPIAVTAALSQNDSSRIGLTRSSKNAPRWTDSAP